MLVFDPQALQPRRSHCLSGTQFVKRSDKMISRVFSDINTCWF